MIGCVRYALIETEVEAGYTVWKDGTLLDVNSIRQQKANSAVGLEGGQSKPE